VTAALAALQRRISLSGPITVADFMAEASGHPAHGYYATRDPFGAAGDFITAPEVSQMFGELVGLWAADVWSSMGAPDPVRVVELGPGRGTLMADFLRAAGQAPAFKAAIDLHLVETSPVLRRLQESRLQATWHGRFDDVPAGPIILIANEFFDALPVHQFQRMPDGWRERMVATDSDGSLQFVMAPAATPLASVLPPAVAGTAAMGAVAEICPLGAAIMRSVAERVLTFGGAALVFDYGQCRSAPGDTLQAVRGHRYTAVLDQPGECDLTAHVDFERLAEAARETGARAWYPVEQGAFLERLGIRVRADMLKKSAGVRDAGEIETALQRLIARDQMGSLFKTFSVTRPDSPTPPGFDPAIEW